ncbi:MAG: cellulase family glycosylhydrolase [Alistipes sp.]|nr:cellulase family glycosylhydrolase [Alistipes sp.]
MKIFKKALAAASSAAMAASMCTAGIGSLGTVSAADMSAIDIVNDMGLGWNLGNTFDSWGTSSYADKSQGYVDNETAWGNVHTTQDIIDAVKAQGFNSVRIPVSWGDNVDSSTFDINDKYLARIKEVIDYCYNNDMYAIINMHWDWESGGSGFLNKGSAALPQFKAMWSEIATYFAGYDNHLVFESLNEVTYDYSTLNSFNQSFVDTVRAAGGNNSDRLLVCSGSNADLEKTCNSQYKVPADDMVAVDIHYYTPATFCVAKQGESWGYSKTWGTDSEKNEMVNNFEKLKTTFVDKGIPVIVGEYGVLTDEGKDKTSIHEFNKTVATLGKSYDGIATYLWDDSDSGGHKYFSRSKLAWHDSEMGAIYKEIAGASSSTPSIGWAKTGVSATKDDDGNVVAGSYIIESGSAQKIKFDVTTEYTRMSGTGGVSYWDLAANNGKGGWTSNGAVFQFVVDENGNFELNQVSDLEDGTITNRGFIQLPEGINVETVQVQFYFAGYATEDGAWTNLKADQYPTISTAYIPGIASDPDPVVTTAPSTVVTTAAAPVTTKPTTTTPAPVVEGAKGNAYLAGGIGAGECWGLDQVNDLSKTAAITGDGQYEVEWVVDPELGGTDTVQFLAVMIEADGTVENFTTDSLPDLEITLDEVWIDGKQLTDYAASENAVNTRYYESATKPGMSRIYLHDDWGTHIEDLPGKTEILESVKVVFTVKGVDAGYVDPGEDILWGDANDDGIVDIADATLILQNIGNGDKYKLSETGARNADLVDNGGGITAMDSLAIQMLDAKLISADHLPLSSDDLVN